MAQLPPPPAQVPAAPPSSRSRSRKVGALVVLFLVGSVIGGLGIWLLTPRPCDDAGFVSERFGYCVDTPQGWVASQAADEPSGSDAFRGETTAGVVWIEAFDLRSGEDLTGFAERVRGLDAAQGFDLSDPSPGIVGEVEASEWEVVVSSPSGDTFVREIVVVQGDVGWRLQIAYPAEGDDSDGDDVESLLNSWRFA